MKLHPFARSLVCLAACLLQGSCTLPLAPASDGAAPVPALQQSSDLPALYAALRSTEGRVIPIKPEASQVRIYVFRAGRSAQLGHNHVLSAPAWEGFAYLPDSGLAQARFDLQFRLDQLVFDLPAHRAQAGPAFAAVLSEAAIAATREHMLGPDNMQAGRYPFVRIHALGLHGEAPKLSARLAVEMHGQTREMDVPLDVTGLPQRLQVSGSLVLRQSDFGVRPYSVLGGLLAVQDEVLVAFSLAGE
jgi:hypothetical protein